MIGNVILSILTALTSGILLIGIVSENDSSKRRHLTVAFVAMLIFYLLMQVVVF